MQADKDVRRSEQSRLFLSALRWGINHESAVLQAYYCTEKWIQTPINILH